MAAQLKELLFGGNKPECDIPVRKAICCGRFGTPTAFGVLVSMAAEGSLAGMLGAGLLPQRHRGRTLLVASLFLAACVVPIGLIHQIGILIADVLLMSSITAFLNVQLLGWFQQRTEREYMGRVMIVIMFAAVGLMPFSLALTGFAMKASVNGTYVGAAVLMLIVTFIAASYKAVRTID